MTASGATIDPRPSPEARRWLPVVLWLITGALAVAAIRLALVLAHRPPPRLSPAPRTLRSVAVERITPTTHRTGLTLPARLEANRSAALSFEYGGRIECCLPLEGSSVKAGEVIAVLNTDERRARIAEREAHEQSSEKTVAVAVEALESAKLALALALRDADALQIELASVKANREFAEKEFKRVVTLVGSEAAPQADLDRATNARTQAALAVDRIRKSMEQAAVAIQAARVGVREAEAALELKRSHVLEMRREIAALKVALDKAEIKAPFAGHIDEFLVEKGEVVAPGRNVVMLYDLSTLRVLLDVPDRYIPLLDASNPLVSEYLTAAMPGAVQDLRAAVTVPGLPKLTGETYAGVRLEATIGRVARAADPESNTFRVELLTPNPGGALRQGMIVEARIDFLRYDNATVIPLKAVQVTDAGPRVFIVEGNGGEQPARARVRDVEPVSITGETILVRSGVEVGDRLIVSGWKGLVDGEEVRIVLEDGNLSGNGVAGSSGSGSPAPIPFHSSPRTSAPDEAVE